MSFSYFNEGPWKIFSIVVKDGVFQFDAFMLVIDPFRHSIVSLTEISPAE
jgi:hypothetical protein